MTLPDTVKQMVPVIMNQPCVNISGVSLPLHALRKTENVLPCLYNEDGSGDATCAATWENLSTGTGYPVNDVTAAPGYAGYADGVFDNATGPICTVGGDCVACEVDDDCEHTGVLAQASVMPTAFFLIASVSGIRCMIPV